ncbi:MAG TPA: glycosyltransferase, partial [Actinomycetota bacterium]|nr:glycosyltransferase [Actinomycetota bacterium]
MTATRRIAMTLEQCWHRVPGGTAVAALGMARGVAGREGLEVRGVAARHSGPPPAAWEPSVPVHQLPLPRLALYESWHHLRWPPVQNATGEVDVIHATTLAIPPRSAPLVVTVHDLAFLHEPGHFTRRGMTFFRRGMKLARRHADLVLCPSRATLEDCAAHGFPRDRLRLVPMAVPQRRATRDEVTSVRARHGLARPYVMWTGTIEPRKNLPRLMAAFAQVDPGVDLVLVGPKGWNEDLQPFVDRLASRVKVLGFVPHEDLPPLYAGAAAFCFP